METLTPLARHVTIHLTTREPTEFIDLTGRLETLVANAGIRSGILNIQTLHTTTAVVVNEHEPLLLASSVSLNVASGRLLLGRWQRVFLVELDGPREREMSVLMLGESGQ